MWVLVFLTALVVCIAGAVVLSPILWYGVGLLVVVTLITGVMIDMMEEDRLRSLSRRHKPGHREHEGVRQGISVELYLGADMTTTKSCSLCPQVTNAWGRPHHTLLHVGFRNFGEFHLGEVSE